MNAQPLENDQLITRTLVPEDQRLDITAKLFDIYFPMQIEPFIYGITDRIATAYEGSYWDFFTLSNQGFYMAPSSDETFHVSCENYYEGELSADALGLTSCLYSFSHLSFSKNIPFAKICAQQYYFLRAFAADHDEAVAIAGATD